MTTTVQEELELQKAGAEAEKATREARRPWLLQLSVPALVTSLVTGSGAYLFGDSAAEKNQAAIRLEIEKNRAATRADVIKQYFSVDNEVVGKRKQMLAFIQATLAKDDPDLASWASNEARVVDVALSDLEKEKAELKTKIASLESALANTQNQDKLRDAQARLSKLQNIAKPKASSPRDSRSARPSDY